MDKYAVETKLKAIELYESSPVMKMTLVGKRASKVQLCNKQRKFGCLLYGQKEGKQLSLEKLEWELLYAVMSLISSLYGF